MRPLLTLFVLVVILAFAVFPMLAQPDTLTIIHVNDTHSNLLPYGNGMYGGIARAASLIAMWKMTEPNPLLVHAGDFMVGTLMFNAYFGVPELMILNELGFDALALGNHEFDGGPETLAGIIAGGELDPTFHILGTNALNLEAVPELEALVKPYVIKEYGDLKVGLFSLLTPATNVISNPSPVFIDTNLVVIAMQTIAGLRNEGADIVILVSHMGLPLDMMLAEYLSGLDVIIGGHSHHAIGEVTYVNNIPIVQAGEFYRYVGKLRLKHDETGVTVLDYVLQEITQDIPEEPSVQLMVEGLKQGIQLKYGERIGDPFETVSFAPGLLYNYPTTTDSLDSPVGSLLTSALLSYVEDADCALEANGHIVEEIYPGPVTPADLFRIYPYGYDASDELGFRLASFDLYGLEIFGVMQALLGFIHPEIDDYEYLPQTAGLDYTVHKTDAGLELAEIMIGDQPINMMASYNVASSDQIVGYLTGLFGVTPRNITIYPVSVYQVFLGHVSAFDTLNISSFGRNRIVSVKRDDLYTQVPDGYTLEQNYPNPFNPSTTITFTLPVSEKVTLKIYNVLGEEIATLVSDNLSAGRYSVTWDAHTAASGVYFYRLQAGSVQKTMKLILLK
jgi:5'-nucleotidase / UDP-sugar diphosphatase